MSFRRSRDKEKQKRKHKKQYYNLHSEEIFNSRYMYITQIEDGTFGRVVRVYDSNSNHFMAMKIIVEHQRDAQVEFRILQQLNKHVDHPGAKNIVHAFEAFNQNDAYCIIFEDLGLSLNQYLKNKQVQLDLKNVQQIMQDSLLGLDFIHTLGYTHTDLKPENILFAKRENDSKKQQDYHVKLIDFGGAVSDKSNHTSLINTRQYRAPEVILRNSWTKQSDMWGLGCILVELVTGNTYFNPGNNDFFHLSLIEKTCQPIPFAMIQKSGQEAKEHFNEYQLSDSFLKWSRAFARDIEDQPTIDELISDTLLRDLVHKILQVEPEKRLTPKQALEHEFLKHKYQ